MTRRRVARLTAVLLLLALAGYATGRSAPPALEECTIGAAAGSATTDGRPMIWKTRDWRDENNEIHWVRGEEYGFLSIAGTSPLSTLLGVNEVGFAILNAVASDLPGGRRGLNNSSVQHLALGTCATVDEFIALLEETNRTGRSTQANLAVMDTTGRSVMIEAGGSDYWVYDTADPRVAPDGYVLRTNFAEHGGGSGGIERFRRTTELMRGFHDAGELNPRSILRIQMRDLTGPDGEPVAIPWSGRWNEDTPPGWIEANLSICRPYTVSATVFQGIGEGERACLTTMWTMLGQTAAAITVPYWAVGPVPPEADGNPTAPLCDASLRIKRIIFGQDRMASFINTRLLRDGTGGGLWPVIFAAEDSILAAAEELQAQWRRDLPESDVMLAAEYAFARYARSILAAWQP